MLHFLFVEMKNLWRKVFLLAMLLLLATQIIRADESNSKITQLYACIALNIKCGNAACIVYFYLIPQSNVAWPMKSRLAFGLTRRAIVVYT